VGAAPGRDSAVAREVPRAIMIHLSLVMSRDLAKATSYTHIHGLLLLLLLLLLQRTSSSKASSSPRVPSVATRVVVGMGKSRHGPPARGQCPSQPVGYRFDTLSISQPLQDLLPEFGPNEGGENLITRALTMTQLFDLAPEIVLRLANWYFVYAINVASLNLAPRAWLLAVTLGGWNHR